MIRRLALLILALAASLSAAAAQGFRTPADLVRASLVAEPADSTWMRSPARCCR